MSSSGLATAILDFPYPVTSTGMDEVELSCFSLSHVLHVFLYGQQAFDRRLHAVTCLETKNCRPFPKVNRKSSDQISLSQVIDKTFSCGFHQNMYFS